MSEPFDLDAVEDELVGRPFEFTVGGKRYRAPHPMDLTLGQQRQLDAGLLPEVFAIVGEVETDDGWVPVRRNPLMDIRSKRAGMLQAQWLAHAQHKPGESQG